MTAAAEASLPLVTLRGARVQFSPRGPAVLDGLDLALERGEFLSLLGPSGCGKSTVLRVMAGLQPLQGGTLSTQAQAPAFVFQEPALMPWANLADNVSLPMRLSRLARQERDASLASVLNRVGLGGREHALPHELSGGMRMRASIARALVMQPDLLLMDEPFAALDDFTRQRLQDDLLAWWCGSGFAVCFVTHQVAEAVYMSSRVAVMGPEPGRIGSLVSIDEPYPRGPAFRRSSRFHAWCAEIADAIGGRSSPSAAP